MKKEGRVVRMLFAATVSLSLMIAGCMVGPDYHPPQAKTPPAWAGASKESTSQPTAATSQPAELALWWGNFGDPKLTGLVNEALQANLSLQLAQARLRQARAQRGVIVGGLFPAASGTASYQRGRPAGVGPAIHDQNLFQAGLDAVWELDVFGGIRRNVESADATIMAAQESIRDVQVSLAAEVALDYVLLRGFQQQIVIARDNLKSQQHTAGITRQRLAAGFVGGLDVANADALVATTESIIPVLETSAQQTIYALSVLLARPPADLLRDLSQTAPLPAAPHEIPIGLPSELLRRRPDIRAAEAQIHAATAQIGVATADLFPKFSLTGNIGWQNTLGENLFKDISRSWSFGPSVSWAIFQGGSILSNIQVQEALRDQAFITYKQTVLTALQDVENALIALAKEQEHRKSLAEAVVANRKAVDLSMQLYTQGQTDFLNVLNAQRSLFASEDALVQSDRDVATDLIALYKALGGGWEDPPKQGQVTSAPTTIPATLPAK
jgi:NodT family efflux transporter outer membrane factor (OMF) lipoprotein